MKFIPVYYLLEIGYDININNLIDDKSSKLLTSVTLGDVI